MLNVSTGSGFWRTTARLAAFLGRKWFVFTRKSRMPSSALTQSPSTSTTLNPTGILPVLRSIPQIYYQYYSIPQIYYQYYTHSTSTTPTVPDPTVISTTLNPTGLLPVLHTVPALNLQYQFCPYCTSTTQGFKFSVPTEMKCPHIFLFISIYQ